MSARVIPESTRQAKYYSAVTAFVAEYKGESDRSSIISISARVEHLLYQILVKVLLPNTSRGDELLDGDFGLCTFGARIHLCYRLGLIDAQMVQALQLLRRLRDALSQESKRVNLRTGPYTERIKEFISPLNSYEGFRDFKARFYPDSPEIVGDLYAALAIVCVRLESYYEDAVPISSGNPCTFVPPSYSQRGAAKIDSKKDTQRLPSPVLR